MSASKSAQSRGHTGSRVPKYVSILILILLASSIWPTGTAHAIITPTIVYAAPGGLTTGICDTWVHACELTSALTVAASDALAQLWAKKGVYKPTTNTSDNFASFDIAFGVAVYGGFAGTETLLTQRNWITNITVLSGDIGSDDTSDANGIGQNTSDIKGSNSLHVVYMDGTTVPLLSNTVLDGFTITGGDANGGGFPDYDGGGLYCNGAGIAASWMKATSSGPRGKASRGSTLPARGRSWSKRWSGSGRPWAGAGESPVDARFKSAWTPLKRRGLGLGCRRDQQPGLPGTRRMPVSGWVNPGLEATPSIACRPGSPSPAD